MLKLTLLAMALLMFSCAQVHNGKYASNADKPISKAADDQKADIEGLLISANEDIELSSENFGMLNITLENTTNMWIRIDSIEIDFEDKDLNEQVKIPVGQQLASWAEGIEAQQRIKQHNTQMLLSGLAIAGAAGAGLSSNRKMQTVGAGATLIGAGGLAVNQTKAQLRSIENAELLPKSHLLSLPIVVSPKLFLRRFVLFYTQEPILLPYIHKFKIKLHLTEFDSLKRSEGKKVVNALVEFRDPNNQRNRSNWQSIWERVVDESDFQRRQTQKRKELNL